MPDQATLEEVELFGHRCQVFEPAQRNPHGWCVVFLHDVDAAGLTGREGLLAELARHGLMCLAPLTGRSWWTERIWLGFDERITAEQYVMERVLASAADRWGSSPPRIALLGVGMGGQGALRLSFKYPNRLPIVAAIAPAIDYQLAYYDEEEEALQAMYSESEAARQDTATLHVHPLNWPRNIWFAGDPADDRWHASADRLKMKLSALGIPHEADLETTSEGATFDFSERMAGAAIGYIAERLERERLRI